MAVRQAGYDAVDAAAGPDSAYAALQAWWAAAAAALLTLPGWLLLRGWRPLPSLSTMRADAPAPTGANTMIELTVEGMSCGHCVGRVTQAVQGIDPAAKVQVDLPSKRVTIDGAAGSGAGLERMVAAIEAAGYPVTARTGA